MRILATLTIILYGIHAQADSFKTLELISNRITNAYNNFILKRDVSSHYDFIIVGSGSAGSVIANRLSELPHWSVLLLEAGQEENLLSEVPLMAPALQFTKYNWHYFMEHQPNMCLGINGHRMHWPRGKALGGSSVINYMIYTRGNQRDYDRWAADGNPGWSYADVLPYFLKSERINPQRLSDEVISLEDHGHSGFQSVENIYRSKLTDLFLQAGEEIGLPRIDYNANRSSFGVSPIQATVRNGLRDSVAKAYLKPIRKRNNLHIITSAFVTQLLIDPHSKKAFGVEYERWGRRYRVEATKEVILSAGALNSPQLLMLAGIGPAHHLQQLGIEPIVNLSVGQNLQDHTAFVGMSFIINQTLSLSVTKMLNPKNIGRFLMKRVGPYTSINGIEALAYIKTKVLNNSEAVPDIELLFMEASLATDYGLVAGKGFYIRDDVYKGLYRPTEGLPTWTIVPLLLHPLSTGYLTLQSKNPYDHPLFYGNYFTDPNGTDIATMLAALRTIQALAKTSAFQKVGTFLNPNPIPGCEHLPFDSDEYWVCGLRSLSGTLAHQVGTAKMGPKSDPTAVVDHELRVHGVKSLRVADCSIVPFSIGAHMNAPAIMIGEKASDLIKAAWGELPQETHK